ncbi:hypothetical protein EYF80_007914 [Liparis tanakae]|uniref:Uncharacterized protein n=1 Tax=Liparis tanakae TaxID=230148 RepID=A0A4Z2IV19_9TELE|nr:hypothetical protein EYF80_007914 [Liparis tanakae]
MTGFVGRTYHYSPSCSAYKDTPKTLQSWIELGRRVFSITQDVRRHPQVEHDNQHRVGLDPEDVAGHIFIIQRFSCGDDAGLVVHPKMTCKQTKSEQRKQDLADDCY